MNDSVHIEQPRAVFDASAAAYVEFVGVEISTATETTFDQSWLAKFAELVLANPGGRVADVGCGPGRVASFLAARGLDVIGFDVSKAMVAMARKMHPEIAFEEGLLSAIPVADSSLAGAVCWYSIMYTPPKNLAEICTELMRVLRPGGYVLLAFQAGQRDVRHSDNFRETQLPLTIYIHDPGVVAQTLMNAGLQIHARGMRDPELAHEYSPQAFVIAQKPRLAEQ